MRKLICQVYKSAKKDGMYLYVDKQQALTKVPEALLQLFGKPQVAMTLVLTDDKKLARLSAHEVIAQIEQQGFYLQMPPLEHSEMKEIANKNSKLAY